MSRNAQASAADLLADEPEPESRFDVFYVENEEQAERVLSSLEYAELLLGRLSEFQTSDGRFTITLAAKSSVEPCQVLGAVDEYFLYLHNFMQQHRCLLRENGNSVSKALCAARSDGLTEACS